MKRIHAVAVLTFAVASGARAQHQPGQEPESRRAEVDHRHDAATGVGHGALEHHFLLAGDGGSIRLEVRDAGQTAARDRIRQHLQAIAGSFAAGDFSTPRRIHDGIPPGADVMKERRAMIRYSYSPTDKGGAIRIVTEDPAALAAVHAFLRFQIRDHGTGDRTE